MVEYEGGFDLSLSPEEVWESIGRTDSFEAWWPWLRELRLEGDGLVPGAHLRGVVTPPLPYRMRIDVELESCVAPQSIDAAVHGDLEGRAYLRLAPASPASGGSGTRATVGWSIEMKQRPMRVAAIFTYPLLRWGHDRVVDATIDGFRRHVEGSAARPTDGPAPG
ncbi:MAG: SRPBCC family protein [Acidimicrobiales bacterium]